LCSPDALFPSAAFAAETEATTGFALTDLASACTGFGLPGFIFAPDAFLAVTAFDWAETATATTGFADAATGFTDLPALCAAALACTGPAGLAETLETGFPAATECDAEIAGALGAAGCTAMTAGFFDGAKAMAGFAGTGFVETALVVTGLPFCDALADADFVLAAAGFALTVAGAATVVTAAGFPGVCTAAGV
jgi:hypothetical protein